MFTLKIRNNFVGKHTLVVMKLYTLFVITVLLVVVNCILICNAEDPFKKLPALLNEDGPRARLLASKYGNVFKDLERISLHTAKIAFKEGYSDLPDQIYNPQSRPFYDLTYAVLAMTEKSHKAKREIDNFGHPLAKFLLRLYKTGADVIESGRYDERIVRLLKHIASRTGIYVYRAEVPQYNDDRLRPIQYRSEMSRPLEKFLVPLVQPLYYNALDADGKVKAGRSRNRAFMFVEPLRYAFETLTNSRMDMNIKLTLANPENATNFVPFNSYLVKIRDDFKRVHTSLELGSSLAPDRIYSMRVDEVARKKTK